MTRPLRITICWTDPSGYMAACWRALQARGVALNVLAYGRRADSAIAFGGDLLAGIEHRSLGEHELDSAKLIAVHVAATRPDIVVLPGWLSPAYRALPKHPALKDARFVMTMDTPYRGTLRQWLGGFRMGSYLRRIDRVVVAGERAFQLARVLDIPEQKIRRGMYGYDPAPLTDLYERRIAMPSGWPRKFLYVGRYVPEKAIDVLVEAYAAYRRGVSDPWPLTCAGTGPLAHLLKNVDGIVDVGFQQPAQIAQLMLDHGAFVLPSRYEPWGVVIAEACAAGLPVLHTEACGGAVELVRPLVNGIAVATDNAVDLARGMRWMHEHYDQLPEMGRKAIALAAPFAAPAWADRWMKMFDELRPGDR